MGALTTGQFVDAPDINPITFDTGDVKWSALRTAPSGWLKCDGSAVSRSTYATLFAAIAPSLGTVTVTIASPGVFTLAAHGLVIGDKVYLTTTGALPTGLSANTIYYVVSVPDANTFTVSATEGGSAINTSGSQSGTHSLHFCPFGLGDGSTTFNLPYAERVISGNVNSDGTIARGSGFTVSHSATGQYVISFTQTLPSVPVVIATIDGEGVGNMVASLLAPTTSGFTLHSRRGTDSTELNAAFSFEARSGANTSTPLGNTSPNLFIKT